MPPVFYTCDTIYLTSNTATLNDWTFKLYGVLDNSLPPGYCIIFLEPRPERLFGKYWIFATISDAIYIDYNPSSLIGTYRGFAHVDSNNIISGINSFITGFLMYRAEYYIATK